MLNMSMSIMEMLCMHPVYVEPGRAKDTCSSELLAIQGFYGFSCIKVIGTQVCW